MYDAEFPDQPPRFGSQDANILEAKGKRGSDSRRGVRLGLRFENVILNNKHRKDGLESALKGNI